MLMPQMCNSSCRSTSKNSVAASCPALQPPKGPSSESKRPHIDADVFEEAERCASSIRPLERPKGIGNAPSSSCFSNSVRWKSLPRASLRSCKPPSIVNSLRERAKKQRISRRYASSWWTTSVVTSASSLLSAQHFTARSASGTTPIKTLMSSSSSMAKLVSSFLIDVSLDEICCKNCWEAANSLRLPCQSSKSCCVAFR
mmetsp:Transcript_178487/g.571909  ORF Transcript_178487/g.571909 Transcript_178487/m.571909 type:complete len:200 (+) Transcript_178487:1736-2335(+)